jgi:ABC-2 type transport system permease protein
MKRNLLLNKEMMLLGGILLAIVAANYLSSFGYFRIDLTSEKRYTLAENTRQFFHDNNNRYVVKVYLDGDLNPGFRKLSNATREMLNEFKAIAGRQIGYELIDPNKGSLAEKKQQYEFLAGKGCEPVPVFEASEDGRNTRTMVFPYAIIESGERSIVVNLLENIQGNSGSDNLNRSIEGLEYKLMDAFRKVKDGSRPRIAFIEGHGELDELDVMDASSALSDYYQVERGKLGNDPSILDPYKAIVIAKPRTPFSEKDKFIIDQYLMNGGRVMWMVDAVNVTLDSLALAPQTFGILSDVNINDQLFKYGIRINPVLVEDIQSAMIPVNASSVGKAPRFVPAPWLFSPLLMPSEVHPVTRNLNVVKGEFVSTIDTVGEGLALIRQVLLHTSRFTKVNPVPVYVSLMMVNEQPNRAEFTRSFLPVAYAQEGVFPSVFQNRMPPVGIELQGRKVLTQSKPSRMIVVADGDIVRNGVRFRSTNPQISPLGYDDLTRQTFGNKQFIVNALNYLTDDEGWMELRSRNYALRLLDKERLGKEASFWKLINLLVPVLIVLITGLLFNWLRVRRYSIND